jgi:DNA-binding GntR family transcriptional regulator
MSGRAVLRDNNAVTESAESNGRLVEELAEILRERILCGRYGPGTRLARDTLADELGASASAVDQALRVVGSEGLAVWEGPGRGVQVATGRLPILLSAYRLREMIDGLAARLAAMNRGRGLEAQLGAAIAEQHRAEVSSDRWAATQADIALHAAILQASDDPMLIARIPLVRATVRGAGAAGACPVPRVAEQHQAIVSAIVGRDPDSAERAARAHVQSVAVAVLGAAS